MTRLNLTLLWFASLACLLCYSKVSRDPYRRYLDDAFRTIRDRGLEEVDSHTLFESAVRGMTREHDPYSGFVSKSQKERMVGDLDQHFSGIGIAVERDPKTGHIVVLNPVIGFPHPALDAGMRAGDRMTAIEGESLGGKSLSEVVKAIRGKIGVPVAITVVHEGDDTPHVLRVVRADIAVDSVLGDTRNPDRSWRFRLASDPSIVLIRITTFGDRTGEELRTALRNLQEQGGIDALILDLRDNAGGYLTAAQDVCDLFIDEGTIVTTRGRAPQDNSAYTATSDETYLGFPMVVLINGNSASASEIVAACLQDHDRATIVGVRSYGKGSVQRMIPMERNQSILKLTTASFWRPSGKNIHRRKTAKEDDPWGVRPDAGNAVPMTDAQNGERTRRRTQRDAFRTDPPKDADDSVKTPEEVDPQLRRAIELLETKLTDAAGRLNASSSP